MLAYTAQILVPNETQTVLQLSLLPLQTTKTHFYGPKKLNNLLTVILCTDHLEEHQTFIVCMYMCTYTCIHIGIHMHVYIYTSAHICIHIYMHTYIYCIYYIS